MDGTVTPMKLIKQCNWCGSEMLTTRSSKILCSQKCHNQLHYWRQKHYPGEGPKLAFEVINNLLNEGEHPNPDHPVNANDQTEQIAEPLRHTNHKCIITQGHQPEEKL